MKERTPTEIHLIAVMSDVGTLMGALYRIAQGVERPDEAAFEALCAVGAEELARQARPEPEGDEG